MTPFEVVSMVKMLSDDLIDYSFIRSQTVTLNTIINEAQLSIIEKAYKYQDERCLRPLSAIALQVAFGSALPNFLHPRGCSIYPTIPTNTQAPFSGIYASYIEYDEYINSDTPSMGPNRAMPVSSYWTVADRDILLFSYNTGNEVADVLYTNTPPAFNFVATNIQSSTGLSIPSEYHYSVCALAAHMIATRDPNEYQKENNEFNGAKMDYKILNLGK